MSGGDFRKRCIGYYRRRAAHLVARRPFVISAKQPVISFTFDDFPRSALVTGGAILNGLGVSGTYYASLGLMGQEAPSGRIFDAEDLPRLFEQGHELGCHTFSHCHSWDTAPDEFEAAIKKNREVLRELAPAAEFKTFAYPISSPRPATKARIAAMFLSCRCGGQKPNAGTADLNQLSAYFLEKSRHDLGAVRAVIDQNRLQRSWLIFATHDIADDPTPFGCTPGFFAEAVEYAVRSGARVLPVADALRLLGAERPA
jgi:Polysaccharide deacetylase